MSEPSINTPLVTVTKALRYSHKDSEHAFIEDLPVELLENIVKHISPESSSKIKSTSHHMQEMVPLTTKEEWEESWKSSQWSHFPVNLSYEEEYRFQHKRYKSQQEYWQMGNKMRLIPVHVFKEEYAPEMTCKEVKTITTTSDGKYMALTYDSADSNIISIFEWRSNKMVKIRDLTHLTHAISAVAVSPDCKRIAASAGFRVAVWNISDGTLLYDELHFSKGRLLIVTAIAFDSDFLILGGKCGHLRVCDLMDEELDHYLMNDDDNLEFKSAGSIVSIRISSDVNNGVAGWFKEIYVSTCSGEIYKYTHRDYGVSAHQDYVEEELQSFREDLITSEGVTENLDIATRYNYLQGLPSANVMDIGDEMIVIKKQRNTVRLRDGEIEVAMENQIVYNCALSPDNRRFFVITSKPVMCDVWDVGSAKKICSYTFGNTVPQDICWSPDGLSITVAIDDVLLRLVPSVIHI